MRMRYNVEVPIVLSIVIILSLVGTFVFLDFGESGNRASSIELKVVYEDGSEDILEEGEELSLYKETKSDGTYSLFKSPSMIYMVSEIGASFSITPKNSPDDEVRADWQVICESDLAKESDASYPVRTIKTKSEELPVGESTQVYSHIAYIVGVHNHPKNEGGWNEVMYHFGGTLMDDYGAEDQFTAQKTISVYNGYGDTFSILNGSSSDGESLLERIL